VAQPFVVTPEGILQEWRWIGWWRQPRDAISCRRITEGARAGAGCRQSAYG
jgi:hypothetical protein